jgi:hypothetical protein
VWKIVKYSFGIWVITFSPLGLLALGHITARLAGNVWDVWTWIPLMLVLWSLFARLIFLSGGRESFRRSGQQCRARILLLTRIGFKSRGPVGKGGDDTIANKFATNACAAISITYAAHADKKCAPVRFGHPSL